MDSTPYTKKCSKCGFDNKLGILEYVGGGVFTHLKCKNRKTPIVVKKNAEVAITVPQCVCKWNIRNPLCAYNRKDIFDLDAFSAM